MYSTSNKYKTVKAYTCTPCTLYIGQVRLAPSHTDDVRQRGPGTRTNNLTCVLVSPFDGMYKSDWGFISEITAFSLIDDEGR